MAGRSAVAVIETPDSFLLEERPDLPGKLAHAGKLQLFGGHADAGEGADDAVRRELREEVGLQVAGPLSLLFDGEVDSQNKVGEPVKRHVSLFGGIVVNSAAALTPRIPGTKVAEIPKTREGIEANRDRLTP